MNVDAELLHIRIEKRRTDESVIVTDDGVFVEHLISDFVTGTPRRIFIAWNQNRLVAKALVNNAKWDEYHAKVREIKEQAMGMAVENMGWKLRREALWKRLIRAWKGSYSKEELAWWQETKPQR